LVSEGEHSAEVLVSSQIFDGRHQLSVKAIILIALAFSVLKRRSEENRKQRETIGKSEVEGEVALAALPGASWG